jgi:hypothetical protein
MPRPPRAFPRARSHPASRSRTRLLVAGLAAALALTGCTSDDAGPEEQDAGPEQQEVAEGLTLSGRWPLTGLPASGEAPAHPVIAVKIDNSGSSSPQIGLGKADLVVEQLVEGGSTRLAALFHSALPKTAGPVRSMRATDIGIVKPADAVLVASGGAPPTVRRVKDAGIRTVTDGGPGFSRDPGRTSPYNVMVALPALAKTLPDPTSVEGYLPWGEAGDLPRGTPARRFDASFSGGHSTSWSYAGKRYTNTNSYAAAGDRFRADNVLVLRVEVGDAGYLDPAGNPVPESRFAGRGAAMLFHGGRMVRATWTKDGFAGTVRLRTGDGPLEVPAGRTWIELVPANGGGVSIG